MTDGSSQGLFVIVAVVIFGIFVLISYMLFRDKLQVGLATIFDDSLEQATNDLGGSNDTSKKINGITYESDIVDLEKYDVAEDSDFTKDNGNWKYIGTKEYVIIPHIIKGEQVTSYSRMFEKNSVVKGVYSDNTNITDMSYMFLEFKSEQLELDLNTSNVTNMDSMFQGSQATSLNLSSFNTENVTNMVSMFHRSKATSLDLSSFDTSNVTDMSWMFYSSQATEIDLSSFDTSSVTSMSSMFSYSQATTLDLSSFDTSSVNYMTSMFTSSKAKELDLRSFDTSNVTSMSEMFNGSQATEIDFSKADFSKVSYYSDMFSDSKIENIYVRTPEDSEKLRTMGYNNTTVIK